MNTTLLLEPPFCCHSTKPQSPAGLVSEVMQFAGLQPLQKLLSPPPQAKGLLQHVLRRDPNHALAADFGAFLDLNL
jgi:hypothetical protein